VVLALVIALGMAAALTIGSRQHPLPPPFGPARNGLILYGGSDHDIHALDLATGTTTSLTTGTEGDGRPVLSPDGTKLLFLRDTTSIDTVTGGHEPMIMVANGDGTNVHALTGALANGAGLLRNIAWSSDASKVAVSSGTGENPVLQVFTVDGSVAPVGIDVHGRTAEYLAFRPGDRELIFRGTDATDPAGMFAVGADGRGFRTIIAPAEGDGTSLSPRTERRSPTRPGTARWASSTSSTWTRASTRCPHSIRPRGPASPMTRRRGRRTALGSCS
jgi:hypothetical protein